MRDDLSLHLRRWKDPYPVPIILDDQRPICKSLSMIGEETSGMEEGPLERLATKAVPGSSLTFLKLAHG
jgi:hypothetical protein